MSSGHNSGDDFWENVHINNEPFQRENYFENNYSNFEDFIKLLSDMISFIGKVDEIITSIGNPDNLHRTLLYWTDFHPDTVFSCADSTKNSISQLKKDCEKINLKNKVISLQEALNRSDMKKENYDIEKYLRQSSEIKITEDAPMSGVNFFGLLKGQEFLPSESPFDESESGNILRVPTEIIISKHILFKFHIINPDTSPDRFNFLQPHPQMWNPDVAEFPLPRMFNEFKNNGLEFLSTVETMIEQFQMAYNIEIFELFDINNNYFSDGGYTLDPSIIGSLGLSILGVFSIAGGLVIGNLAVILTGCVAVLSAINSWPYKYEINRK